MGWDGIELRLEFKYVVFFWVGFICQALLQIVCR